MVTFYNKVQSVKISNEKFSKNSQHLYYYYKIRVMLISTNTDQVKTF